MQNTLRLSRLRGDYLEKNSTPSQTGHSRHLWSEPL